MTLRYLVQTNRIVPPEQTFAQIQLGVALAAEMAAKGVLVEVNLSSTAAILEVSGKAHPYAWLRQRWSPAATRRVSSGGASGC